VAANLSSTALKLAFSWLWLNFIYYQAFFGALSRLGEISLVRREERRHRVLGDAEVLRRTARGGASRP
jgi:hypothetical protein